ncbi:MAG: MBL fold metallo-hydrolase [Planctomycetes bacterium]|nr:MBL fold metallo-hydrolase [Planctomycetota bacterium]
MASRISPLMWPVLVLASPLLVPKILWLNRAFKANRRRAETTNRERINGSHVLPLPALDFLELTVLVDENASPGFRSDPGVSYLIRTNQGAVLFDVGFGPDSHTLAHNANRLGVRLQEVDAVAISHLHPDHMGGTVAFRSRSIRIPPELSSLQGKPCYLPERAEATDFEGHVVQEPQLLGAGTGAINQA